MRQSNLKTLKDKIAALSPEDRKQAAKLIARKIVAKEERAADDKAHAIANSPPSPKARA